MIPFLEMFNSVLKHEEIEEKLEDILDFYHKNKTALKEPYSFNRNNSSQPEVITDIFQKNKSSIPTHTYKAGHQYSSSEESEKKHPSKVQNESSLKEKEIIKNSIVNMNISGNYSQMKSKLISSGTNMVPTSKINQNIVEDNEIRAVVDNKSRQSAFQG